MAQGPRNSSCRNRLRRRSSRLPHRSLPMSSPVAFPTDVDDSLDNPDLGPFLLKLWHWARVAPPRALQFAERAARVLER
jgi:hypothetical protein